VLRKTIALEINVRVLLWIVLGFVIGAIVGYFAVILWYIAYTELFRGGHDQDGGGAMAAGLIIGPAVGLICGLITAVIFGVRAAGRKA
jgi:hypothetical protein